MKTSDKKSISRLVEICRKKILSKVIFSPGSRNAPLVIGFSAVKDFQCETIPDERVAAFVALGKGIATKLPSIICCTSGSAVLNYAPAIVEAYYQRVPLLVLTADRPSEWIDQGIGQSMRQANVYDNYIKGSFQLIEEANSEEDLIANDRIINEAIDLSLSGAPGPVHVNIPFHEPLYGQEELIEFRPEITLSKHLAEPSFTLSKELKELWTSSERKIIIAGLIHPNPKLNALLTELTKKKNVLLLTETTSNQYAEDSIQCLDRVLAGITNPIDFQPDLLISIGGPIISKKIKEFFLKYKPKNQWYVDSGHLQDTYRAQPVHLNYKPAQVLEDLAEIPSKNNPEFQNIWSDLQKETSRQSEAYLENCPFSDLKVIGSLLREIPANSKVHLANSTPIRYVQLFDPREDLDYYCNRGVSGIDGSTSTALGFASEDETLNVLITGDMSFIYDSNAFWQSSLPKNLKIILINNAGGGIFRYIPGPSTTDVLEEVFEAHHNHTAKQLCDMYSINYESVDLFEKFMSSLEGFWGTENLALIEVHTPRKENDKVLKGFFSVINSEL